MAGVGLILFKSFFKESFLQWSVLIFLKDFIYLFLEKGGGREKKRERNINVWLPVAYPQLGWLQGSIQSTEPYQLGLSLSYFEVVLGHPKVGGSIPSENTCLGSGFDPRSWYIWGATN